MREMTPAEKYIGEVFGLRDPDLEPVRAELVKHQVDFMAISGQEARLLQFLMRAFGVLTVVEVGTLFGYSALCMAKALPDEGRVFTLEKNPFNWEIAQGIFRASAHARKITSLCGDGRELLAQIEGSGPFDMVFIDADKSGYVAYLDWAETHVRRGGLIVGDNTLWRFRPDAGAGQVRAMDEFNRRLADTSRYSSTLIPTTEGMTVAQKLF